MVTVLLTLCPILILICMILGIFQLLQVRHSPERRAEIIPVITWLSAGAFILGGLAIISALLFPDNKESFVPTPVSIEGPYVPQPTVEMLKENVFKVKEISLIVISIIVTLAVIGFMVYKYVKRRKETKIKAPIETYDVYSNLSYPEKLEIFKRNLPKEMITQWNALKGRVQILQKHHYYKDIFNEIEIMINDFAARSVINECVSNTAIEQFNTLIDKYREYIEYQEERYNKYTIKELETVQPSLDIEHMKILDTLNLMMKEPLEYK